MRVLVYCLGENGEENPQQQCFDKADVISNKAGPFDLRLCLGGRDLTATLASSDQRSAVYVLAAQSSSSSSTTAAMDATVTADAGPNSGSSVVRLGGHGVLRLACGLSLAYIGGDVAQDSQASACDAIVSSWSTSLASSSSSSSSQPNPQRLDVLALHYWPVDILRRLADSSKPANAAAIETGRLCTSHEIATWRMIETLKPRYIFAAQPISPIDSASNNNSNTINSVGTYTFFERQPFSYSSGYSTQRFGNDDAVFTRFIGLAGFGNERKEKWIYAMNVDPASTAATLPEDCTEFPFRIAPQKLRAYADRKRQFGQTDDRQQHQQQQQQQQQQRPPPPGYVCRKCNVSGHYIRDCPLVIKENEERAANAANNANSATASTTANGSDQHKRRRMEHSHRHELTTDRCWFCLSNPQLAKHLIVSIGSDLYVTLAKGSLIPSDKSAIPGAGHVLLVPIDHHPSLYDIEDEEASKTLFTDIERYQAAIAKMYAEYNCIPLTTYVQRPGDLQHAHFQMIPIPLSIVESEDRLEQLVIEHASKHGVTLSRSASIPPPSLPPPPPPPPPPETDNSDSTAPTTIQGFRFSIQIGTDAASRPPLHAINVGTIASARSFNLQLGRQLAAEVLGLTERSNWRDCLVDEQQETAMRDKFKQVFQRFNPMFTSD
ncbi:hypothetical protein GQ42DRAFT_163584 [Ramicandelaber brevisporus]|nr:hypothetical protein GQ42DRAFT_163584 [Ramicandelaber brevisporus]